MFITLIFFIRLVNCSLEAYIKMLWVIKLPVIRYAYLLIDTGGKILYHDFIKLCLLFQAYIVHAWTIVIVAINKYPIGIDIISKFIPIDIDIITHDG